jgi:O-antigen ligase
VHRLARRALTTITVLAIAWGVLAFGGVYPWAYYPLAAVCAGVGVAALIVFRPSRAPIRGVAAGLAAIAAVMVLQLIPLPPSLLATVSPATDRYVRTYDLAYTIALAGAEVDGVAIGSAARPITLDPPRTRLALLTFVAFALFTLGLTALLSASGSVSIVRGIVAIGGVVALVGVVQYTVTGGASYTLKIYGFWTPEFRGSPFGPFVNRNHFAGWMLMGIPLAIATVCGTAASFRGAGFRRFIAWLSASSDAGQMQLMAAASAVMTLSVLMASSRSGLLGFGVATVLATWLVLRRQKTGRARAWAVFIALFLIVCAAGWAGFDRLVLRLGTLSADGSSAGGRLPVWRDSLTLVRNFPITGAGLNAFGAAMVQYQTSDRSIHFEQAHNDYLQILAEGGLLMLVAVGLTLVVFVNTVRQRFREAPHEGTTYWTRVGAVVGLAAIAVQSLFEFSLQLPGNAVLFAVLVAIAIHRSPNLRFSESPKELNYGYPSHSR